ncbi:MAG: hypothetical protein WBA97_39345 [Actinophytocola sp.]
MRVALHTRLKPGRDTEHERVHMVIPGDLEIALRDHPANVPWQRRELS